MAETKKRMICPRCDAEMNHHGDKLVYSERPEGATNDVNLAGFIEEFHTCPACGEGASRRA